MNALPIIIGSLCVIAISYRYYSAFIAAKVLALDDSRPVPSQTMYDGHNYYPTNKWVLFGHHFAAISGAGPLIGPVLAAQFGFLPGLLWLVIGVCIGGAVHDFMILAGSVRRKGKSLAEMARTEISPLSGLVAGIAILFIVVIALAGLGLVVVNALAESAWGTFTVAFTIPLALFMGLYMYRFRKGKIAEASIIGVIGLLFAVYLGGRIADSSLGSAFTLSRNTLIVAMAAYGFIASVLACLDASLSARLPFVVFEDWHDRFPDHRRDPRSSESKHAGVHTIYGRWRASDSRKALSVCLHHDRVWRYLWFSRAHLFGHDTEDDRQRN